MLNCHEGCVVPLKIMVDFWSKIWKGINIQLRRNTECTLIKRDVQGIFYAVPPVVVGHGNVIKAGFPEDLILIRDSV